MRRIDLNVDIGEGFPYDVELLSFAASANVCCGEHAGSWELTMETIHRCLEADVRIGMHPGYPDRASMGRASMQPENAVAYLDSVRRQVEQFYFFVPAAYLKPHGALYNDAVGAGDGSGLVRATIEMACARFRLPLMALPGTALARVAALADVPLIREGFADRAYLPDGTLMPRTQPGAVYEDSDTVRSQVLRLAGEVDSICIHGDTPDCLEFAELVFRTLMDAGFEVGC
jgi:5-oxoprolinase (ATP-hydrolysing) subunit A